VNLFGPASEYFVHPFETDEVICGVHESALQQKVIGRGRSSFALSHWGALFQIVRALYDYSFAAGEVGENFHLVINGAAKLDRAAFKPPIADDPDDVAVAILSNRYRGH
jgi:hypothetical protein